MRPRSPRSPRPPAPGGARGRAGTMRRSALPVSSHLGVPLSGCSADLAPVNPPDVPGRSEGSELPVLSLPGVHPSARLKVGLPLPPPAAAPAGRCWGDNRIGGRLSHRTRALLWGFHCCGTRVKIISSSGRFPHVGAGPGAGLGGGYIPEIGVPGDA